MSDNDETIIVNLRELLKNNDESPYLLDLLHKRASEFGEAFFVPHNVKILDAYMALEDWKIVETTKKELRIKNDGIIRDGFIECNISKKSLSIIEAAFSEK